MEHMGIILLGPAEQSSSYSHGVFIHQYSISMLMEYNIPIVRENRIYSLIYNLINNHVGLQRYPKISYLFGFYNSL